MARIINILLLSMLFLPGDLLGAENSVNGTITAQFLTANNEPLANGIAFIYDLANGPLPSRDRYWRVPEKAVILDSEGRLQYTLPPGEYCLAGIKRNGPLKVGPPTDGELFVLAVDATGVPLRYLVKPGEVLDAGKVRGAVPFRVGAVVKGVTAFTGIVTSKHGEKIEGAVVFAFVSRNVTGRPMFVSDKTGPDGRFILRVAEGGTYYLKVRDSYGGGPPDAGGVIDGIRNEPLVAATVKRGELARGISLKSQRFPGRGPGTAPGRGPVEEGGVKRPPTDPGPGSSQWRGKPGKPMDLPMRTP